MTGQAPAGYSLRRRTLNAFLLPLVLAAGIVVLLASAFAYSAISAQHDEQMRQTAALLVLLGRHEATERDGLGDVESSTPMFPREIEGSEVEFRIWSDVGIVTGSSEMPDFGGRMPAGFSSRTVKGVEWRVFATTSAPLVQGGSPVTVELAEPEGLRRRQTVRIVLSLGLPLALMVLAVALIGSQQVRRAMRPIGDLTDDLDSRDAGDLRQVDATSLPQELAPLVQALNDLFRRLEDAFEREREFTDNAAHELRTPVAALKARAQILERKLAGNAEAEAAVAQFNETVDRTAYVIDRLLEFARLTAPGKGMAEFDLTALIEDEARMLAPLVINKPLALSVEFDPGVRIVGAEDAVRLAFRNVLLNAIKFTPGGGTIDLVLRREPGGAMLSVADSGPGIAEGEEERIFERFWRGSSSIPGSGLGLALVARVARMHGGSCKAVRRSPTGLEIVLRLPEVPDQSAAGAG